MKLSALGFLALLAAAPLPAAAAPARQPPNVLFLFTDDQRHDTIHALGCGPIVTPNLDRLAQEGTAFLEACIMGGTSGAVCVPSRAMLMTGRSLFHLNNAIGNRVTFPQWFKQRGYVTFMAGKWHNEQPAFRRSFTTAAAVYFGGMGKAKRPQDAGEGVEITVQDYDGRTLTPASARREGCDGTGRRRRGQVPRRLQGDQAVPGVCRLDLAPRSAHRAQEVPRPLRPGQAGPASELPAGASIR
jgi:arylsulfatase A-like enzyme